ncbi:BtpA/SgcQ family protein [Sporolactobacillus shoreae]|uniref:BtpA/SgcQ family protein n=1 Tax=Sporolactobacillus shoreae TaxID=1465501 RepID=A0A4Z0GTJ9_9BACL|nr:BtpA/SgcQ family protein [Sporolactobacillus shoreae]
MVSWIKEVFDTEKPIIAMCHLQALPGDPDYDATGGMDKVIVSAKNDVIALQEGGVDGIMFSNEYSLPYLTKVETVTVAAMARVIGELRSFVKIPYGVNCLWDPIASLDLAAAVDAQFIREIISGVYASDFGLWNTDPGKTARHRLRIGAKNVKMFYNIVPEAAKYLADRDISEIAKTTEFNNKPDAICVSGLTAGSETDTQVLKVVKDAVRKTPIFCNTGCNKDNIERQLSVADGAICATTFKVDGIFENPVDYKRVKEFMDIVKEFRN